jgi:site-specific DNA recombinase
MAIGMYPSRAPLGRVIMLGHTLSGVKRNIVPEQASVIRRIFEAYSSGRGVSAIAHILNAEAIPAPGHSGPSNPSWCPRTIRRILLNEHYRGPVIWNRTGKVRNPESGRTKTTIRPQTEWVRTEAPECRIISENVWFQAQTERKRRLGRCR